MFKLYNETYVIGVNPVVELSRLLLSFDYSPLQALTSSILNPNSGSFKAYLNLHDIYGGQTTPSNFVMSLYPLAKTFDEGRGLDVKAFRDLDTTNWLSASSTTAWTVSGALASGSVGDANVDFWISGSIGGTSQSLEVQQTFARGDEDLLMDVTTLVSASMTGQFANNGFRLSFLRAEEVDSVTRFVKRFGSRHTLGKNLHPHLIVKYDDHIADDFGASYFGLTNNVYVYNAVGGSTYMNFVSGTTQITGSNSLILTLISSKSVQVLTTSFQQNFSGSLNYSGTTFSSTSVAYFSTSFSASQAVIGGIPQTGIYFCPVSLSLQSNTALRTYINSASLGGSNTISFATFWQNPAGTLTYTTGSYLNINRIQGTDGNVLEHNWVVNITNLQSLYAQMDVARFRVFILDYNQDQLATRIPIPARSTIIKTGYWRVVNAFDKTVVIPFDTVGTLMSYDNQGMYFDLYMSDLDLNQIYEIEFQIVENNKNHLITNQGFRFKVVP